MSGVTYQQFMGALAAVQEASMRGDEAAIAKFSTVLRRLMPQELSDGRYRILGGLLLRLDELMPLFSSSYASNPVQRQKLERHARDIFESVDFVLGKLSSGQEFDRTAVKEILDILSANLKGMERLRAKFQRRSVAQDMAAKGLRGIVCHASGTVGRVVLNHLEKRGIRLEMAATMDDVATYLDLFEGEYGLLVLDHGVVGADAATHLATVRKMAPGLRVVVTVPETALKPPLQAALAGLGCRVVGCPSSLSEAVLARIAAAADL